MNEIFDKLILRIALTLFICAILLGYKYLHSFLYPTSKQQLFRRFHPAKNSADTIHLFARLLGIGIVFSHLYFYLSGGIVVALFDFLIQSIFAFLIYLGSIYILETIVLSNFEYSDEITKKKNMAFALISATHSIALAFMVKTLFAVASNSLVMMLFLWLFAMVLIGFATKSYKFISKIPLTTYLYQKNLAVSASYAGFFSGWILIINESLSTPLDNIRWYIVKVILSILLAMIILPLFRLGLVLIFKIQEDYKGVKSETPPELGDGVYEGVIFFTSSLLTAVITGQINFGTFYPIF